MKYPELVTKLTSCCSAWIVGGAVDSDSPRDYDIYVPFKYWQAASMMIPRNATINRMGGFKCISEGVEIDVWTGEMSDFLACDRFHKCYHPHTGTKIIRYA